MKRFIVRSFFQDIKNFKNMIPYRIKKIEEADIKPLPEAYGVNELSAHLHPDKQTVRLSSVITVDSKTKIITLSACNNKALALYRAGQGINIKIGKETTFFPLLSSPKEKDYSIIVYSDFSDSVSQFLFHANENTQFEVSGPTGLFYYSHLRDGNSVVFICDIYGVAPVLSICRYLANKESTAIRVVILHKANYENTCSLFDNISVNISVSCVENINEIYENSLSDITVPSAFFISGKQDFCNEIKASIDKFRYLKGKIRLYISDPCARRAVSAEKYSCQVFYRDQKFCFDCFSNEVLLSAFERNNIPSQAKCKVGECGYCRCKLLEGKVETVHCSDIDSRRSADEKYGFIHPCRAFPVSDLTIIL